MLTIFVVVAVTYYAFSRQIPFTSQFGMHALVNNSVALRVGSPVRIAGIDVGAVDSVSPGPGRTSRINFNLDDSGLPVHTDATVTIRDRLFLEGGYYLQLDPGSPSAPIAYDGFTIPESQTAYPVQFFNVLSTFDLATRQSLENTLNSLNDALSFRDSQGRLVADPGAIGLKRTIPQLTPLLKDTAWISRGLRGTQAGDIARLLSSTSAVTATVAGSRGQLQDLVTSLDSVAGAIATDDGALARSVAGLDRTLQVAPRALTALDAALPPVTELARTIDPALKQAPPLLDGLVRSVAELGKVVAPAARAHLLTALNATFAQFPSLLTKLAGAFPLTKALTDCLQTHVTPLLNAVVPDGALTTGDPVWKEFVHFLPTLASAAQNFDGNGGWARLGPLGVGTQTLAGLGTIPGVGQLFATGLPGNSTLQGSRPASVGNLGPDVFQPGVPCSSQKFPALASATVAPDFRPSSSAAARPLGLRDLAGVLATAAKRARSGR